MKERNRIREFEHVTILDAGAEGKAVGRIDEQVVFVPFAAPGDVVDIRAIRRSKSYWEGKIIGFHQKSDLRIAPFCDHFGICGGCKWQHISYSNQLKFKQKQVKDSLDRIAKVSYPDIAPILGSPHQTYYRNKLEFAFSNRKWHTNTAQISSDEKQHALGFHMPKMFDRILEIDHCWLQQDPSNHIRLSAARIADSLGLKYWDAREQVGDIRNLIIRIATTGEIMVIVAFYSIPIKKAHAFLDRLLQEVPEIQALMYTLNDKRNDVITDLEIKSYKGPPYIMEEMPSPVAGLDPLIFKIGPVSFFQTNTVQAANLYKHAFDLAQLSGHELVYDLYTGTGTIACYMAASAYKVVGVEYVPEAIEDARENARINGFSNLSFFSGDMAKVLDDDFVAVNGRPEVVITDPPRAGMLEKVTRQLIKMGPQRIVYISCNPATQARDVALLDRDYEVKFVQPVDMFPHTHHVENIILLQKRD